MIGRFFSFGCSFTQYIWPTWADIIGKQSDFYQNWGRSGAGNQFILNALIECDIKNCLTKDDLVCIMFTNVCREDRYVKNEWITPGNIFTQKIYDSKFVKSFTEVRGYYIRDLATIYVIDKLLTQIGCKKFYFSMVEIVNPLQYEKNDVSYELYDLFDQYQSIIDKILPSVHATVFNYDWYSRPNYKFVPPKSAGWFSAYYAIKDPSWPELRSRKDFLHLPEPIQKECREIFNFDQNSHQNKNDRKIVQTKRDIHPVPLEHLEYLEKVCPEFVIEDSTKKWIEQIHELGSTQQDYAYLLPSKILNSIPSRW